MTGKNNRLLTFLCSLSTYFISSTLLPVPFIVSSLANSLSVPSSLHLLLLKQLPLRLFSVPLALSYIDPLLNPLYSFSILSFAHPNIISLLVSCQWQNILPYLAVNSQWQKIVPAFPTFWKRWVRNSPKDGCNCYYFASTVYWPTLSASKITNINFALYTVPVLCQKNCVHKTVKTNSTFPTYFPHIQFP